MGNGKGREIELLLQILKGAQDLHIPVLTFNTGTLLHIAEIHRVNYQLLVFAQNHPGFFSPPQMEALDIRCRRNSLRSLSQLQELIRVARAFHDARISLVAIKGPQLARMIYGREALKESVDLDFMLVHESWLDKAHEILSGMGYRQSNLNSHTGNVSRKIFLIAKREVHYFNAENQYHIDLHIRAGSNTYLTAGLFRNFFTNLESHEMEGSLVTILPREQYLVYLCYHGSLHQFSRLAWLMDIRAFLSLNRDGWDYDRMMSLALEIHAERSVFVAMALLQIYFGDELPARIERAIPRNHHFGFLVNYCRRMLSRDPGYGLTLQGRAGKLLYMMLLTKGFAGRVDLIFGIFTRILTKWI